jgi:capsular exopolysaccharide synthesis family protein
METRQPQGQTEIVQPMSDAHAWHFRDAVSVLYRKRWLAAATFLVAAAAVVAYTLTATPVYEAHAQLLLEEKPSIVTFQGLGDQRGDEPAHFETQNRILHSRSLARRVIEELDLWNHPGFKSTSQEPAAKPFGFWQRWRAPRADASPSESEKGRETSSESIVIDRLLSHLTIESVHDTRIIEVKYESPDPALAARIVNTLVRTYISQNKEARSQLSNQATSWLASQLAEQRQKVEASELALQKYRERENNVSLDAGQNIVVQRLNALNAAVTKAKTDLIAIESLYRRLVASQNDHEALDTFPMIRSNNRVQEIRVRLTNLQRERIQLAGSLGAKHPEMRRLDGAIEVAERELASEVASAVESVRQDYLAALAQEKDLSGALDRQKASALAVNRQSIEYSVLLREVESNRQIYQSLLQRANEAAVSSDLQHDIVEILDPAEVPRQPVRPDTRQYLLIGLVLSALLAVAVPFGSEVLDTRVQTPAQIKNTLGIPFLGTLPRVSKRALKGRKLVLGREIPAAYAEACRALRTNVLAMAAGKGQQTLLVTSASPGDGKSVISVNLAFSLGRSGKRVLLIDADLRRPTLHELLDERQQPGLTELLIGSGKPSEAIKSTRCPGVWLLPSGAGLVSSSEQLGSTRFSELLKKLSESFDWVIIDSPPVMAVTDSAVIARMTTGVLFVVNARRTQQRVAQAALDALDTAGATFAGAVLNDVTWDRNQSYNASYYLPSYADYLTTKRPA